MLQSVAFNFWSESIWLSANRTWKEFENPPTNVQYARPRDLWLVLPVALLLHLTRLAIERFVWCPIGRRRGLRNDPKHLIANDARLESMYKSCKRPDEKELQRLAYQVNKTERYISNWFRKRRNNEKSCQLQKFCEAGWKGTFYFCSSTLGIYIMWDKPWIFNSKDCWTGFPFQHVTLDIYIYYLLEMAYYSAAAVSIFFDVKRKDLLEFFIHHLITLALLFLSWSTNFFRIGSYVLVIHDFSDYWLEGAKMLRYANYSKTICDIMFATFGISWYITRCMIYPHEILGAVLFEGPKTNGFLFPASILGISLLVLLQVLHCIWSAQIARAIVKTLRTRQLPEDPNSNSEFSPVEDQTAKDKSN